MSDQRTLLDPKSAVPDGFRYHADLLDEEEERALVGEIARLPFRAHRDRAMFGDVLGVSLLSSCTFRFRKKAGARWERASLRLAPRSTYLLRGPARTDWEHSIPGVQDLRYSLTFRTFTSRSRPQ